MKIGAVELLRLRRHQRLADLQGSALKTALRFAAIAALGAVLVFAAVAALLWNATTVPGPLTQAVNVVIPRGAGPSQIAELLAATA